MKILLSLLLSFFLMGCSNSDSSFGESEGSNPKNSLNCIISGDKGGTFAAVDKDVKVGFLQVGDRYVEAFFVGFKQADGTNMSTGMFPLDLNSRSEQTGTAMGMVDFGSSSDWMDRFSSLYYPLYYDTNADERNSKTYITLTKAEKLKGGYLHLAGRFRFNASNNVPFEKMPIACLEEALQHTDRYPRYLASLAGTSQVQVSGNFDVTVLVRLTEW
ncbi:hypothetical protein ACHRV1_02290 [Flavobacterium aquidurense]|jgi:hypothetical protein|uniref:hypothetical protein n=1 Tax=Flavobacterium aquidurense TaxID=362413 RepID=UPI003757659E